MQDKVNGYPVVRSKRHEGRWPRPGRLVMVQRGPDDFVTAWQFDGDLGWWLGRYFHDEDALARANVDFDERMEARG